MPGTVAVRIAGAVERRAVRIFWMLVAVHVAGYFAVALAVHPTLPMDMSEVLTWGREWWPTYWKHPPLASWLLQAVYALGDRRIWPLYLVSPLCVALTYWAVWTLARDMVSDGLALLAVLPLMALRAYGFDSPDFQQTVASYAFFALIPLLYWRALTAGRWWHWALLGLAGALAMSTKYAVVPLLLAVLAFQLGHPRGRATLSGAGLWLALAVLAVALLPHGLAAWRDDFQTFDTPAMIAPNAFHWWQHLAFPASFALRQMANLSTGLAVVALLWLDRRRARPAADARFADGFARTFVLWHLLAPLAVVFAYAAVAGLLPQTSWTAPFLPLLGLAAIVLLRRRPAPRAVSAAFVLAIVLFGAGLAGYAAKTLLGPRLGADPVGPQFPGAALAAAVEDGWARIAPGRPMPTLIGSFRTAGRVSIYGKERYQVFVVGRAKRSPWIDAERVAREGALVLWFARDGLTTVDAADYWVPPWYDSLCIHGVIELPMLSPVPAPPVRIAWASFGPPCGKPAVLPDVARRVNK
ncbi:MAG: glycosyltransferase family 39 protein [Rhodospirillales bacterium]